jgi:hypothetical protein
MNTRAQPEPHPELPALIDPSILAQLVEAGHLLPAGQTGYRLTASAVRDLAARQAEPQDHRGEAMTDPREEIKRLADAYADSALEMGADGVVWSASRAVGRLRCAARRKEARAALHAAIDAISQGNPTAPALQGVQAIVETP